MSSEIRAYLEELKNIAHEMHSNNAKMKGLRSRKKELEEIIVEYLEVNNKPGLKLDNIVFLAGEKNSRMSKKKSEIKKDMADVLKRYGIDGDPSEVLDELDNAKKGMVSTTSVLKMKAAGMFG